MGMKLSLSFPIISCLKTKLFVNEKKQTNKQTKQMTKTNVYISAEFSY